MKNPNQTKTMYQIKIRLADGDIVEMPRTILFEDEQIAQDSLPIMHSENYLFSRETSHAFGACYEVVPVEVYSEPITLETINYWRTTYEKW